MTQDEGRIRAFASALSSSGADADVVFALATDVVDALAEGPGRFDWMDVARPLLQDAAQPVRVLRAVRRLAETEEGRAALFRPDQTAIFVELARQGEHPARVLVSNPSDIVWLARALADDRAVEVTEAVDALDALIAQQLSQGVGRPEAVCDVLRSFKRREALRIFLREVREQSSVRQTTREIADVAEAALRCAVKQGARELGAAELSEHFCVLGMGKLGGRELNFSSDVDLIYVASDAAAERGLTRDLTRLAKWVTAAMAEVTGAGYVFRVDLRLRPEGSDGPLVPSLRAMEAYYQSWGRTWERSALIKARPVAGNLSLGLGLLARLESFLFRRYLDFDVIDELRGMKQMINEHARASSRLAGSGRAPSPAGVPESGVERKSGLKARLRRRLSRAGVAPRSTTASRGRRASGADPSAPVSPREDGAGWDVKVGVGGIREVEFFVQALQLVHCGRQPALRVRGTLDALDRLLYAGLVSHEDHARLADAYDLFRRVEHRVQMERDRQTHRIPADPLGFERLAKRLFVDVETLREQLSESRCGVSSMFARLFEASEQTPEKPTVGVRYPEAITTVFGATPDRLLDAGVLVALERLGFGRPRQVAGQIEVLREKVWSPQSLRSSPWKRELAYYVVFNCAQAPDPDQAFSFWTRLATRVARRPGFARMFHENPHATRLLLFLFGSSRFLSSIVVREPYVIEYALGARTATVVRDRSSMASQLSGRLAGLSDPSHRLGRLRRFQQEETLRVALHEIGGAISLDETVEQLSTLAEVCVQGVLGEVYAGLQPQGRGQMPLAELPLAVVAMGKLGGGELGFGSDLDLFFVYDPRPGLGLDHAFFARLAQRLVRNLSSVSAQGKLYEIDTRLRPSGSQGTLVVSLGALEAYHRDRAQLWERQAMIRARTIAGPSWLASAVARLRQRHVFDAPLPADARARLREMRARIDEAWASEGPSFDVKFGEGGLVDAEFLTQYLQLRHGRHEAREAEPGETLVGVTSQSITRALEALAAGQAEPALDLEGVAQEYRFLRRVEARLRIADLRENHRLPSDQAQQLHLARRLGYQGSNAVGHMLADITAASRRIRGAFEEVFGVAGGLEKSHE